jgi:hypothetical protein
MRQFQGSILVFVNTSRKALAVLLILAAGLVSLRSQDLRSTPPILSSPSSLFPTPAPPTLPTPDKSVLPSLPQNNNATDAARFLAGIKVSMQSPLSLWTQDPRWIRYSNSLDDAFAKLEQLQLSNIRIWRSQNLDTAALSNQTCLYLFSGPDFLYADTFFPNCTTYVMQGLEPADLVPDLSTLPKQTLLATLQNIEASLYSEFRWSFFVTKYMREDFQRTSLRGVLPIIYVFLARGGKEITDVRQISLSKDGTLLDDATGDTKGVRIGCTDITTGTAKTIYYFTANLSDDHIERNPELARFCSKLGPTNALLKAASYLMFAKNFSTVRNLILKTSSVILEDDSGIPFDYFSQKDWTVRVFGTYTKPVDLFKQYYQPSLRQWYVANAPLPLTFAFGYQWNPPASGIILAIHSDRP